MTEKWQAHYNQDDAWDAVAEQRRRQARPWTQKLWQDWVRPGLIWGIFIGGLLGLMWWLK